MQVKLKKSLIAGGQFYRAGSILELSELPTFAHSKKYCERLGELAGSGPKPFVEGEERRVFRGPVTQRKGVSVPTPPAALLQAVGEDSFQEFVKGRNQRAKIHDEVESQQVLEEVLESPTPPPRKPRRG